MDKSRHRTIDGTSGTWLYVDVRSVVIVALTLMFSMAAFVMFWHGETPATDSAVVKMAAAKPAINKPVEESADTQSAALVLPENTETSLAVRQSEAAAGELAHQEPTKPGMIWTDEAPAEKRPTRLWRTKHLSNRHYAAIDSQSDSSELSYLCMEGVSCGWVLDLKNEKACNKDSKGEVFSVRVQAPSLVRDFESKCIAYGLVSLAFDASERTNLTSMIRTSESLVFSSIGSNVIFKSQHYDFPGSFDAINSVRLAAGIDQDNRSL